MAENTIIREAGTKLVETADKYSEVYAGANQIVESFWQRVPSLIIALVVFIIFWLLAKFFKFFVSKTLGARAHNKQNLVLVLHRIGSTFIVFFGLMIAMVIAIPGFTPGQLISALGIGSVAIGFAFKDVFQNLLSGILLLLSEPFRIGDEIVSGNFTGVVEDIQIRATTIRTSDGRRIVIPNAQLYTNPVTVNTAYLKRRCSFDVGISYDADIDQAKKIILEVLDRNRGVESQPVPAVRVTSLGDFAIILTVRWWVDRLDVGVDSSVDEIQTQVKKTLDENDIGIPYPTQQLLMANPGPESSNEDMDDKLRKQRDPFA